MLKLTNVCFSYGEKKVLENFSLEVKDGECVCISGESGCGKTTVLRLVSGLEKPHSGTVECNGKVSVVFQEDRLLPWFSLWKNICLTLDKKRYSIASELIEEVGLGGMEKSKPDELSGGMKRRAAIVRAVAFEGDVLLLDEPFNGLDSENKKKAAEMIKREYLDRGKSILMVSHIKEDAELMHARTVKL